jgi:gamma-tubulin complex component 2
MGAQGLKGVEALTLEYKVGWPVSIILSRRALTKYQLLSRLLYFSKYVEVFGMRYSTVNFDE